MNGRGVNGQLGEHHPQPQRLPQTTFLQGLRLVVPVLTGISLKALLINKTSDFSLLSPGGGVCPIRGQAAGREQFVSGFTRFWFRA